jgi:uncharacterized RDD family membrane protein YckC
MDSTGGRAAAPSEIHANTDPVSRLARATWGQRTLAQLVDAFVAFGVFYLVGMTLAPGFGGTRASGFELEGAPAILMMTVVVVLLLVYFAVGEAVFGATLGKAAAGIRVRRQDGHAIGPSAALLRNSLRLLDGQLFYLVGVLVIMLTQRRQRLGDLAARSDVVQHPTPPGTKLAAAVLAIALAIGAVAVGSRMRRASGPLADFEQRVVT